eukprot:TRINITY_DN10275_c0_g1_i1.p1 TRINITY_DN10275_c0_g1~~TRINITY_DN10275_c0_g1_i1.p1  ORF type:complete len:578 (+),score=188.16 TRINITY_DN10275_c0_g1_i1:58-1791(+)
MQTSEIKELYAQKTGAPPGPAVSRFIETLKVREVAKIWSAMGEGEDFIGAIKRIIGDQIRKAGGEGDVNDLDLDANLRRLEELKKEQEREAKEKAEEKRREKERLAEEKKRREEEEVQRKIKEEAERKAQEEQQKRQEEAAAEKKRDAARKEAEAKKAEEEARIAQEAAAKALAAAEAAQKEREAADQVESEAAAKRMEEARAAKEAAEQAEREAKARAKAEKEAAEAALKRVEALNDAQEMMKVVLEQQKREREEQERLRQKEREEADKKLAQAEAEAKELEAIARGEESEDEDAGAIKDVEKHEEALSQVLTVKRNDKEENLGIHGLIAVGNKVRAIELTSNGACERAGMKSASVIRDVNGVTIVDKESLVEAVNQLRQEGLLEFQMVVEAPLSADELNQDLEKVKEERKRRAKEQVTQAMKTANQLIIDMCLVGAKNLNPGSSKNIFCEVKLRTVTDGVVGSSHPNAQKSVTKTVKGELSPHFDHKLRLVVPPADCIRISIFGSKTIGKEYKGRVDLVLTDIVPNLNSGGKATIQSHPVVGEEKRGEVSGSVEVAMRVKGFVSQEAAKTMEKKS